MKSSTSINTTSFLYYDFMTVADEFKSNVFSQLKEQKKDVCDIIEGLYMEIISKYNAVQFALVYEKALNNDHVATKIEEAFKDVISTYNDMMKTLKMIQETKIEPLVKQEEPPIPSKLRKIAFIVYLKSVGLTHKQIGEKIKITTGTCNSRERNYNKHLPFSEKHIVEKVVAELTETYGSGVPSYEDYENFVK